MIDRGMVYSKQTLYKTIYACLDLSFKTATRVRMIIKRISAYDLNQGKVFLMLF